MKILVTGAAGFIGYHLCKSLISINNIEVVGLDSINDYYDVNLKYKRLEQLGIIRSEAETYNKKSKNDNFCFIRLNLQDKRHIDDLFKIEKFEIVCNLAAQAGVRYSLTNPHSYIESNIIGFLNILEGCKNYNIEHLIYASSSSVYGKNSEVPFSTTDKVDNPISLYAATKKSNELMAHTYSHLYSLKTTGLRFFTVYGPWGRPDMALFLFTDSIHKGLPIDVYNFGKMQRDFTYIDDIINGINKIILSESSYDYKIYNIGNNNSIHLTKFIDTIEKKLGKKSKRNYLPIQPGDVEITLACVDGLIKDFNYHPETSINYGIGKFIDWYLEYYA